MNKIIVWCEMFGSVGFTCRRDANAFIKRNKIAGYIMKKNDGTVIRIVRNKD